MLQPQVVEPPGLVTTYRGVHTSEKRLTHTYQTATLVKDPREPGCPMSNCQFYLLQLQQTERLW